MKECDECGDEGTARCIDCWPTLQGPDGRPGESPLLPTGGAVSKDGRFIEMSNKFCDEVIGKSDTNDLLSQKS